MSDEIVGQCQCGASLTPYHKCQGGVTSGGTMTPERLTPERERYLRENYLSGAQQPAVLEILEGIAHLRTQADAITGALRSLRNWSCPKCGCVIGWKGSRYGQEGCVECSGIRATLSNPAIAQRLADAEELRAAIEPFVQGHEQMQRDPQDTPDTRVLYHKGITLGVIARLVAARDRMWGSK